jgi:hypothetical protein
MKYSPRSAPAAGLRALAAKTAFYEVAGPVISTVEVAFSNRRFQSSKARF